MLVRDYFVIPINPPNLARTRHKTLRQKEVHLYGSSRLGGGGNLADRKQRNNSCEDSDFCMKKSK